MIRIEYPGHIAFWRSVSAHAVMNRKRRTEQFYTVRVDAQGRIVGVNEYVITGRRCSCPAYKRQGQGTCKHLWLCEKVRHALVRRKDARRDLGWRLGIRRKPIHENKQR